MNHGRWLLGMAVSMLMALSGCAADKVVTNAPTQGAAPRATLQAFNNEQEIRDLFKGWAEEHSLERLAPDIGIATVRNGRGQSIVDHIFANAVAAEVTRRCIAPRGPCRGPARWRSRAKIGHPADRV